jgi:serine/threonine-protein kinase RIM15
MRASRLNLERWSVDRHGTEEHGAKPFCKASVSSSTGEGSGSDHWSSSAGQGSSQFRVDTPPSSVLDIDLKKGPDSTDCAVTCLLVEDNPVTAKIL